MSGFLIANYRVTNPEAYATYPQAVVPTLLVYGGEILVADYESEIVENEASNVTVVVKFPSKESARAWYNSPGYQEIVRSRIDNTEGFLLFADEFNMP